MTEPEMLCDGCGKIKSIVEPTEDGKALLCKECLPKEEKEWKIDIFYPHPVGNGSPFTVIYTGTREHMCNLMEAIERREKFGVRLQAEATDEGNTCHFCGTFVVNGYEIGLNRRNRHWLSDCRPDLVEHEPGELCTWHGITPNLPYGADCYAYQNDDTREWTNGMKSIRDIHAQIDPRVLGEIKRYIEWAQDINSSKAVELSDLFYSLEKEMYRIMSEQVLTEVEKDTH